MADATATNTNVQTHDAILSVVVLGVKHALPNLGDNQESNNSALVELFEKVNLHLAAVSLMTDCFYPGPPTVGFVKEFHNLYVRLNLLIDTCTKPDNIPRLEATHITVERRKFRTYPVRYFDMRNSYTKRWTELFLQGLSNIAQMSENVWANDWSVTTAIEMKKLFREAYRLMCVAFFGVTPTDSAKVFDNTTPFFLKQTDFDNYSVSDKIPQIEWIQQPAIGSFYTEDEYRDYLTPTVEVADGVMANDPNTAVRVAEKEAQNTPQLPQIVT